MIRYKIERRKTRHRRHCYNRIHDHPHLRAEIKTDLMQRFFQETAGPNPEQKSRQMRQRIQRRTEQSVRIRPARARVDRRICHRKEYLAEDVLHQEIH